MRKQNDQGKLRGRAAVESLESRRLFTASAIGLDAAGLLTVAGNTTLANTITVVESADGKTLTATVKAAATKTKSFAVADVKHLLVTGGSAADVIDVGQTGGTFTIATKVKSGGGADLVKTGPEADTVNAGAGADTVFAGGGNDLVHGGAGPDELHGGDGNDTLWGSAGADTIDGDAGNDLLGGILGKNTVNGGAGSDLFYVAKTLAGSDPVNDFVTGTDTLHVAATEG